MVGPAGPVDSAVVQGVSVSQRCPPTPLPPHTHTHRSETYRLNVMDLQREERETITEDKRSLEDRRQPGGQKTFRTESLNSDISQTLTI